MHSELWSYEVAGGSGESRPSAGRPRPVQHQRTWTRPSNFEHRGVTRDVEAFGRAPVPHRRRRGPMRPPRTSAISGGVAAVAEDGVHPLGPEGHAPLHRPSSSQLTRACARRPYPGRCAGARSRSGTHRSRRPRTRGRPRPACVRRPARRPPGGWPSRGPGAGPKRPAGRGRGGRPNRPRSGLAARSAVTMTHGPGPATRPGRRRRAADQRWSRSRRRPGWSWPRLT